MTNPVVPIVIGDPSKPLWVEMPENDPARKQDNWVFVASDKEAEKNLPKTFDEAVDRIKPLAEMLFSKLSKVATPPKEMELSIGLKLSGTVGVFVAQSTGEASLTVKLKWTS